MNMCIHIYYLVIVCTVAILITWNVLPDYVTLDTHTQHTHHTQPQLYPIVFIFVGFLHSGIHCQVLIFPFPQIASIK